MEMGTSKRTTDETEAERLVNAMNEAEQVPAVSEGGGQECALSPEPESNLIIHLALTLRGIALF